MSRTSSPAITVLLPAYNGERFLAEQIESVLAQTRSDLHLVIWDDGSSDDTLSLSEGFAARDHRVRVLSSHVNKGLLATVESLASLVDTPYFAMCDQDDIWDQDKLEVSVTALESSGAVLVYSDVRMIDGSGSLMAESYWQSRGLRTMRPRGAPLLSIYRNPVIGHTVVATRRVASALGPRPKGIRYYEPWLLAAAHSLGSSHAIERPLGSYRVHTGNVVGPAPTSPLARVRRLAGSDLRARQSNRTSALRAVSAYFPEVAPIARHAGGNARNRLTAARLLHRTLRSECSLEMTHPQIARESLLLAAVPTRTGVK